MSFDYQMVRCPRCGSSSALEYGNCQKCGQELKASNTANFFLLGIGAAVIIITLMSLLIYLTRGTVLGRLFSIGHYWAECNCRNYQQYLASHRRFSGRCYVGHGLFFYSIGPIGLYL